jgi:rhodanese-related sulfurtransferase
MQSDHDPEAMRPHRPLPRRGFILLGIGSLATAGAIAAQWYNILARNGAETLTPAEAHAAAQRGDILLVDIRRPDEWARTGVAEGAMPIDMRSPEFAEKLLMYAGTSDRAVALICARGVRSRRLAQHLVEAGFTNVIDVPEGMLGSGAGPGWIEAGLPLVF